MNDFNAGPGMLRDMTHLASEAEGFWKSTGGLSLGYGLLPCE
jgi:hypothetical protein